MSFLSLVPPAGLSVISLPSPVSSSGLEMTSVRAPLDEDFVKRRLAEEEKRKLAWRYTQAMEKYLKMIWPKESSEADAQYEARIYRLSSTVRHGPFNFGFKSGSSGEVLDQESIFREFPWPEPDSFFTGVGTRFSKLNEQAIGAQFFSLSDAPDSTRLHQLNAAQLWVIDSKSDVSFAKPGDYVLRLSVEKRWFSKTPTLFESFCNPEVQRSLIYVSELELGSRERRVAFLDSKFSETKQEAAVGAMSLALSSMQKDGKYLSLSLSSDQLYQVILANTAFVPPPRFFFYPKVTPEGAQVIEWVFLLNNGVAGLQQGVLPEALSKEIFPDLQPFFASTLGGAGRVHLPKGPQNRRLAAGMKERLVHAIYASYPLSEAEKSQYRDFYLGNTPHKIEAVKATEAAAEVLRIQAERAALSLQLKEIFSAAQPSVVLTDSQIQALSELFIQDLGLKFKLDSESGAVLTWPKTQDVKPILRQVLESDQASLSDPSVQRVVALQVEQLSSAYVTFRISWLEKEGLIATGDVLHAGSAAGAGAGAGAGTSRSDPKMGFASSEVAAAPSSLHPDGVAGAGRAGKVPQSSSYLPLVSTLSVGGRALAAPASGSATNSGGEVVSKESGHPPAVGTLSSGTPGAAAASVKPIHTMTPAELHDLL